MAVRITTKMMQSKSLYNLNTNKTLQEKLTSQLSTQKKITRPSDDPVVAIRSLKLNSTLNKIDQYYEKNAKDAESWLKLTESAIATTNTLISDMKKYINQASNGDLTASDRSSILQNLSNYRKEIYATGNADSDGRSIFTGYRTNTSLTFIEDKTCKYEITEQRTNSCLDTVTYVQTGALASINEGNFTTVTTNEYYVGSYEVARIRTAYDNLDYDETVTNGADPALLKLSFLVDTKVTTQNNEQGVNINTTSYSLFAQTSATAGEMTIQVTDKEGNASTLTLSTDASTTTGNTVTIDGVNYDVVSSEVLPSGATAGDAGTTVVSVIADANGNLSIYTQEYSSSAKDANGDPVEYKAATLSFSQDSATGDVSYGSKYETKLKVTDYVAENVDSQTYEGAYMKVYGQENADKIVYIAETGEILLGANIQAQLAGLSIDSEIRFSYEKSSWKDGDLNPIHYFYTKIYDDADSDVTRYKAADTFTEYNATRLEDMNSSANKQLIYYDIGNNQSIQVNTLAEEIFTHDIGRDVDEVITMLSEYEALLDAQDKVKKLIDSGDYSGDELETLKLQQAALNEATTRAKDKVQKTCESLQTTFDGYLKQATLADADMGARSSRLTLIQNRLAQQQTSFQELVSENEDADITDLAIQLSSVELTYEAALSSISYVMKTTLLDFI